MIYKTLFAYKQYAPYAAFRLYAFEKKRARKLAVT